MKAFNRPTGQHTRAARSFTCTRVSQGRSPSLISAPREGPAASALPAAGPARHRTMREKRDDEQEQEQEQEQEHEHQHEHEHELHAGRCRGGGTHRLCEALLRGVALLRLHHNRTRRLCASQTPHVSFGRLNQLKDRWMWMVLGSDALARGSGSGSGSSTMGGGEGARAASDLRTAAASSIFCTCCASIEGQPHSFC